VCVPMFGPKVCQSSAPANANANADADSQRPASSSWI
jgi:hypothetical protein